MPDTLTTREQEPVDGVTLNEAEQAALETAEQLEQEQNPRLAGKFNNTQELEKAYKELESKLGKQDNDGEEEVEPELESDDEPVEEGESEPVDYSFLDKLYEEASTELTDETVEKLQNMDVADLADMYVEYRSQVENQDSQSRDFSSEEVGALYGMVGGKENYGQLINWAQDNISQDEQSMFDQVMESGDPVAAFWAVRSLAYQYADNQGYEGERLSGKTAPSNRPEFRSQSELVQAMSDPRYENDPAYRQDVETKLANSNLSF